MLEVLIYSKTLNQEANLDWDGTFESAKEAITKMCGSSPVVAPMSEEVQNTFAKAMAAMLKDQGEVTFDGMLEDGRHVELTVALRSHLFNKFAGAMEAAGIEIKSLEEGMEELTDRVKSVGFARPAGFYGK